MWTGPTAPQMLCSVTSLDGAWPKASSLTTTNNASALTHEGLFGTMGRGVTGTGLTENLVSLPQLERMRSPAGRPVFWVEKHVDRANCAHNYYNVTHCDTGEHMRYTPQQPHGFYGSTRSACADFDARIAAQGMEP